MAHQGVIVAGERVKIVHRDLKPANIFLVPTALGELVKILDFGIAKKVRDYTSIHNDTNLTNMFVGTFRYAAPEQLEINLPVDERVDIYCLGLILYEMLSGTDPFGLSSNSRLVGEMTWAGAHVQQAVMTLQLQPGCEQIPASLTEIVNKCLQKSPDQRYASIQELQSALDDAIATEEAPTITKQPLFAINEKDASRTIVQSSNASPVKSAESGDGTIVQAARTRDLSKLRLHDAHSIQNLSPIALPETSSSRIAIQRPISEFIKTDSTIVQFRSDSRHNLDTTVCQGVATMPNISDRLSQKSSKVSGQENQNQDIDRGRRLFPLLLESPSRALSSVWVSVRSWIRGNFSSGHTGANSSSPRKHHSEGSVPAPEVPTLDSENYEDAIKTLNECRLSYAKELARNGRFRNAIATAKSIPETSLLHSQAQMLINRWKHI
jgi:serine/threonine-protein kinase